MLYGVYTLQYALPFLLSVVVSPLYIEIYGHSKIYYFYL